MIVCQENLDYGNHIKIPFGTYVLAKNEPKPTNVNAPRHLGCIYQRATDSAQECHELLHLQTNSVMTRYHVTPSPINPTIINQLHTISDMYGIPSGIKIANRTGLILYYSDWIVRVDYSEDDDNEKNWK